MNRRAMAPTHPVRSRLLALLNSAPLALLLTLGACGQGAGSAAVERPPLEGAAIGGDFTLVDKAGKPVRWADFAGKYRIVYFGYTFCPDVCPLDLQHIMQGYHLFARDHAALARDIVPLFITVDPQRDTPTVMGEYSANFGPELIGLTGTPESVAAAGKAFAVYAARRPGATPGSYLMDHSVTAFLMGRDGKPIALLPAEKDGKAVAAELARWVR
ncbi:SCO family protein [Novosphingobium lentum]|uniref:SCO family protein n=1 Tax=Novosphingobium lentum TaxID=145287 RepID=UPI0008303647|nr:SCO family protein [Novosphingobium lentum]